MAALANGSSSLSYKAISIDHESSAELINNEPSARDRREQFIHQGWKICRLLAGSGVAASSAFKVAGSIYRMGNFDPLAVLIDVWMFVFGIIMVLIEDFRFSGYFRRGLTRRRLYYNFRFLYIPPGRGYFYLLPASLMLATSSDIALPVDYPIGVFVGLIAIVSIIIGHITTFRLTTLKEIFTSEAMVRRHFELQVTQVPDELNPLEFNKFCEDAGLRFGPIGLDGAISIIDSDQNGCISQQEIIDWWLRDL